MKITEGITWVMSCTTHFAESVEFFRDTMGLAVSEAGVPVTETQFTRYAQFKMPNGIVLEIVEPTEGVWRLYDAPIVSITVDNLAQARRDLENRQIEFVAPIFQTPEGWAWTYFRAPDGHVYQLQGAYP
jgi:hypothetical protein